MKKNLKMYAICWAILLAVFNIICFITPSEAYGLSKYEGAFWVGYIFITLAFIGQIVCASVAFKAENTKKFFYNLPLITLSYIGLVLTVIFGSLCMVIPNVPNWVGAIVCLLILAFTAIAVIKATVVVDIVEKIDNKVKEKTLFIKSLMVDADNLLARTSTPEMKETCKKVFEAIRYSDPMTNDALAYVESQITLKFNEFAHAVTEGRENIDILAEELIVLIGDRNKKCRSLK